MCGALSVGYLIAGGLFLPRPVSQKRSCQRRAFAVMRESPCSRSAGTSATERCSAAQPTMYVLTLLHPSLTQLFLLRVPRSGRSVESDAFFIAGNALVAAATPSLFGMSQAIAGGRYTQTLSLLVVSPANRVALFLGRSLPAIVSGAVISRLDARHLGRHLQQHSRSDKRTGPACSHDRGQRVLVRRAWPVQRVAWTPLARDSRFSATSSSTYSSPLRRHQHPTRPPPGWLATLAQGAASSDPWRARRSRADRGRLVRARQPWTSRGRGARRTEPTPGSGSRRCASLETEARRGCRTRSRVSRVSVVRGDGTCGRRVCSSPVRPAGSGARALGRLPPRARDVVVHFHRGEDRARELAAEIGAARVVSADLTDEGSC